MFRNLRTRTGSPSVYSRSPSEGSTSFFLASALFFTNRPCDLPVKKTLNASNRFLPPNRTACTRTSCVPNLGPKFPLGSPRRYLGSARFLLGDRTFHDVRDRFGGSSAQHSLDSRFPSLTTGFGCVSTGVFFPWCWCDRASDTSVMTSTGSSSASLTFASAASSPCFQFVPWLGVLV